MKKTILLFVVLFVLFFVYTVLDCPSEVDINSEFVYKISGKTSNVIISGSTKVDDLAGIFDIGLLKNNNIVSNVVLNSDANGKFLNVDMLKKTGNIINNNLMNDNEKSIKNSYISDIGIKKYDLDFKSDIYEYILEIENEDKLDIVLYLEECEECLFVIRNNDNLVDGSVIEIENISNDDVDDIYKIKIIKNGKDYTLMFVSIIIILVIINVVRIIISLKRSNDN